MPSDGFLSAEQKPFAAEMPMRMPVNDPGPTTAAKKSHSSGESRALCSVSSTAPISRTECFRCFQRITGQSPKSYLNSYRIRQATHQLETTDDSITDICFSCGFNHMSYFVKRFRESTGVSPGKYRNMAREAEKADRSYTNMQQKQKGDQEDA